MVGFSWEVYGWSVICMWGVEVLEGTYIKGFWKNFINSRVNNCSCVSLWLSLQRNYKGGYFLIGTFGVALLPFKRCHLPKYKRLLGLSPFLPNSINFIVWTESISSFPTKRPPLNSLSLAQLLWTSVSSSQVMQISMTLKKAKLSKLLLSESLYYFYSGIFQQEFNEA